MAQSTLDLILRSRKTGTGAKEAEQELDALGKKTSQFGTIAKGVAVAGIGALVAGLALSVNQAIEAEQVMAATEAVIKSTGGVAGLTADEVGKLADSLSHMSGVDDELIQSAENVMLTFTSIGKDVFPSAMEAALNMSTALGTDLQGSVIQVGKALQDPINGISALRRVGVNFNDEAKTTIKRLVETGHAAEAQAFILKELSTEFGGAAKAAGDTFGGQLKKLENELGNAFEAIGTELIPIIKALIPVAMGAIDVLKGFATIVRDIAIVTGATKPTIDDMSRALDDAAASGKFSAEAIAEARAKVEEMRVSQKNSLEAAKAWNENVTEAELVIRNLKPSVDATTESLEEMIPTEKELEEATKAVAKANEEAAEAAMQHHAALEKARESAANAVIGFYDLAGSLLKVNEMTFVKAALEGLNEALEAGTITENDYRVATEQLMLAHGLATPKSLEMAHAQELLNGLLNTGLISTADYTSAMQLIPQAAADGKVSLDELGKGGRNAAAALADAAARAADVADRLARIERHVEIEIVTRYTEVNEPPPVRGRRPRRQFGGPVSAGEMVEVHSPEMFFPSSNGFIMSQADTRHMLSLLEQIAGGLGRSNNITINAEGSAGSVIEAVNASLGRQSRSKRIAGMGI